MLLNNMIDEIERLMH